nr:acetyl-CoA carboxylase biotin carboxyl carrier protein [Kibdelosporangium sp. MJ126-NF4]CEL20091.1 Biotin carboxyl carrier protein of acetyl-CoA carboxylase [Kibdelosporangium sp. MJ126-NF4]CTQ97315.1 Biotin carboxyl carrier protein of acetyl-CoA carboxylase [Kibdelosporangium sp. MJ126-NF4]
MAPQHEQADGDMLAGLRAQTLRLAGDLPGALRRLSVRSGDAVIEVEWQEAATGPAVLVPAAVPAVELAAEMADESIVVCSPMVGTVYHAPSPDQPPFVTAGDMVEVGQTVLIIEAMKLFNPIVAEQPGVVIELLVDDGAPVEFDQPLLRLKTSADEAADVH